MGWEREILKSLHIQEQTACEAWSPIFEPNQPTTSPHSKSILFASSMDQSRWSDSCNASTYQVLKNCPSKGHPGLTRGQRLSSVWISPDFTTKTQKGADCLCPSLISGCRLHLSFRRWQWAMNFQFMISCFHHGASVPSSINHCRFEFLQCFTKSTCADLSVRLNLLRWRSMPYLVSLQWVLCHRESTDLNKHIQDNGYSIDHCHSSCCPTPWAPALWSIKCWVQRLQTQIPARPAA